jgi:hypothetical protein
VSWVAKSIGSPLLFYEHCVYFIERKNFTHERKNPIKD